MTNLPDDYDRQVERERIWRERGERSYNKIADDITYRPGRTIAKWVVGFLLLVAVLWVGGCALGLVGDTADVGNSYRKEIKRTVSAPNVAEQNRAIIEDYESLEAAAANACGAATAAKQDGDPTLVEDPALAYKATYRRIRVDYNRRMANLYEAQAVRGLPLPSNLKSYPKVAPTVEQKMQEVC